MESFGQEVIRRQSEAGIKVLPAVFCRNVSESKRRFPFKCEVSLSCLLSRGLPRLSPQQELFANPLPYHQLSFPANFDHEYWAVGLIDLVNQHVTLYDPWFSEGYSATMTLAYVCGPR